tara:strand:- start:3024 stop:3131 length:108 start_codon:yes stop_codon:yes gene_type:complete
MHVVQKVKDLEVGGERKVSVEALKVPVQRVPGSDA